MHFQKNTAIRFFLLISIFLSGVLLQSYIVRANSNAANSPSAADEPLFDGFTANGTFNWGKSSELLDTPRLWYNQTLLIGVNTINRSNNYDVILTMWNRNGTMIWNITWGGAQNEFGIDVKVLNHEIFVLAQTFASDPNGDIVLVKFNMQGQYVAEYSYGQVNKFDVPGQMATDGQYLYIVATSASYIQSAFDSDLLLLKYDSAGQKIFNVTWGGSNPEQGDSILLLNDSIYVSGTTNSFNTAMMQEIAVVKFDLSGNKLWNQTIGSPNDDWGSQILSNKEALVVAFVSWNFTTDINKVFVCKLAYNGTVINKVALAGNGQEIYVSLFQVNNLTFVAGQTNSSELSIQAAGSTLGFGNDYLVSLNKDLEKQKSTKFTDQENTRYHYSADDNQVFVVKSDSNDNVLINEFLSVGTSLQREKGIDGYPVGYMFLMMGVALGALYFMKKRKMESI